MSMHIEGDCGGYDGDDALFEREWREELARDDYFSGACDDDVERTAPFIDGDPIMEQEDTFFSRPLKDSNPLNLKAQAALIDAQMKETMRLGFEFSMAMSRRQRS